MSQVRAGAAFVELTLNNSAFVKGLRTAQKRLSSFASSTSMMGAKLTAIGAGMAAPLGAGVQKFAEYDDAIRQVAAVTGATGKAFDSLNAKAKQLGATTSFSAVEVANLMAELGRAGFAPKQIEDMTGSVMALARATGTEATLASGIFAAAIRQFNLEASDASRVADGLTAAANKSFNSVESLGEALSYAGPVAADANMSLEETLAILGTLGNLGIQGSSAGNALKRLLTLSAAESKKFQDVFGVATKDAAGNARPLVDVLGEVAKATENLGSGDRAAKFNEVFGLLGITAASAIGKSVTDTRTLLDEIENAGGVAKKTAGQMESGLGGAFRVLSSSFEAVRIALGEALEKPMQRITESISSAASAAVKWISENKAIVQTAAMIAIGVVAAGAALLTIGSAAAAASMAIGGLLGIFSAIGSVVGMVGTAIAALLSPIGIVVTGLAALGIYLAKTSGLLATVSSFFRTAFAQIATDSKAAFKQIAASFAAGDITGAAKVMWAYLTGLWKQGVASICAVWDSLSQTLDGFAGGLISSISGLLRSTLAWANENRSAILTAVAGFAAMKVAAVGVQTSMIALKGVTLGLSVATKTLAATWTVLKTVGAGIKALFIGLAAVKKINIALAGVYAAVTGGLSGAFGLLTGAIASAAGAMGLLFSPLGLVVAGAAALGAYFLYSSGAIGSSIDFLKGAFAKLKADTLNAFGAIANALRAGDINAAVDVLWSYIKLQWTRGTVWLSGMWSKFTAYLSDQWSDAIYSLADMLVQGLGGLRSIWNATVGYLADGWTIVTSAVQKGWNNTVGFLKKGFLKLHELVDIAGDVAIQIGSVLVGALAGVENAWVETIDYLADSWSVFVGEVKKMWNSTVGFLRKAWVKLKALFDDDINVEAEVRRIDAETDRDNRAQQQQRQATIAARAEKRRKRKAEIEANRKQMQEGLKQQLEARRKAREGQDLNAEYAAIDADTGRKNAAIDADRDRQFAENEQAAAARTKATDEFTEGVRDQLDQIRSQSQADREAKRNERTKADADREAKVAAAEADFNATVEHAKSLKPGADGNDGRDAVSDGSTVSDDLAAAIAEAKAALDAAKADVAADPNADIATDPRIAKLQEGIATMQARAVELQQPDGDGDLPDAQLADDSVDLKLDRDSQQAIDGFADSQPEASGSESVTGKFESRGQSLGSGARKLEPITLQPAKLDLIDPPETEVIEAPKLTIEPDQPANVADPEIEQDQAVSLTRVEDRLQQANEQLATIGQSLAAREESLTSGVNRLGRASSENGLTLSDEIQRAIVETAANTRKLADQSSGRGLVFS